MAGASAIVALSQWQRYKERKQDEQEYTEIDARELTRQPLTHDSKDYKKPELGSTGDFVCETPESYQIIDYGELPIQKVKRRNDDLLLFFDTETTGLPRDKAIPATQDDKNWPRLVQLAWIITDQMGHQLKKANYIIRPIGYAIPSEAEAMHGISTYTARMQGETIGTVLEEFMNDLQRCFEFVCHNVWYDKNVISAELLRLGRSILPLNGRPHFCTMEGTTEHCAIYHPTYGWKWPRLSELHTKLFGYELEVTHDAATDVQAIYKCYFALRRRKIIRE